MENENKEKVVLNEEELKKVSGGAPKPVDCKHSLKPEYCNNFKNLCIWIGGKCVSKASL